MNSSRKRVKNAGKLITPTTPTNLSSSWGSRRRCLRARFPGIGPEARWRDLELPLECAIERRFRFVSHLGGDLRDRVICRAEHLRSQLQPPARQISHGSFIQVMTKSFRQNSA